MRLNRLATALFSLLSIAAAFQACDSSSVFYSDADRKSIYTVAFSGAAGKLASGSPVQPGSVLSPELTRMAGSSTPETLTLDLLGGDGKPRASLSYSTGKTGKALSQEAGQVTVASLSDVLPAFSLPKDLEPGDYTMRSILLDQYGETLQRTETVFFVAPEGFASGALSVYPPNPVPGQAVLLQASVNKGQGEAKIDPWIRWSSEGRVFASGLLSNGLDKVVWRAPSADGAYAITMEFFPAPPSTVAESEDSPWHTEIKAFVAKSTTVLTDLFGKESRFTRRLAFEGSLADSGSQALVASSSTFGSPRLETYPGGFGLRLDASSGLSLPAFILPENEGAPLAASLVWRLYLDQGDGDLLRIVRREGGTVFRASLEAGRPVVEVKGEEGTEAVRSAAETLLGSGFHDLALSLIPSEKGYSLLWTVDGERVPAAPIPAPVLDGSCTAFLGGATGLPAIYDEFALSDDSSGAPPFLRVAAERRWRSDLMVAEGFEGGAPAATDAQSKGTASAGFRAFGLGAKTSLAFTRDLPLSKPLAFDVGYTLKDASLEALLLVDGAPFLRVTQSGDLILPDGSLAGMAAQKEAGRLAFSLKATPEGVEVAGTGDLVVARIATKSAPRVLRLTLQNPASQGSATLSSVIVRAAPELLSAADAPRMARAR